MATKAKKFTQEQLNSIMEQGVVRQCACPSLLTRLLSDARYLHDYQESCINGSTSDERVHEAIARATERVSAILEACLLDVLAIEEWKPVEQGGYRMPERLIELQISEIAGTPNP